MVLGERIELDLRLAGALPGVEVGHGALEQAVMQLALNARDAMSGGGQLVVSTAAAEERVVLAFSDTGAGMDAATAERAIEPFFTTRNGGQAIGLGLTTVHTLCRLGGELELESTPGQGTTVRMHLPAIAPAPASAPVSLGTVLMVEDEESVLDRRRPPVDRGGLPGAHRGLG